MIFSTKYSYLVLRFGLAIVFFWFGVDKFLHPDYWLQAWVPDWVLTMIQSLGVTGTQFIIINGIFEVLIGLSLVTGVFMRLFSAVGILFLIGITLFLGVTEITVRDIGIVGGLLAIFLWPERKI